MDDAAYAEEVFKVFPHLGVACLASMCGGYNAMQCSKGREFKIHAWSTIFYAFVVGVEVWHIKRHIDKLTKGLGNEKDVAAELVVSVLSAD